MGMATVTPPDTTVRESLLYKGCFYCPSCQCHYKPNMEWGYCYWPRGSTTTADQRWTGIHRKGDECPYCGRKPEGGKDE